MHDELRDNQYEAQKFARRYEEVARKLAEEQEHSRKLADEILRMRAQFKITEAERPRREALDERI
jgi:hypothetical protein